VIIQFIFLSNSFIFKNIFYNNNLKIYVLITNFRKTHYHVLTLILIEIYIKLTRIQNTFWTNLIFLNLWYYELLKYLKQVIIICAQYFSVCRKRSKVSQIEIRKLIYTLVEMDITREMQRQVTQPLTLCPLSVRRPPKSMTEMRVRGIGLLYFVWSFLLTHSRTHVHAYVRRAFIEEAHAPHPSGDQTGVAPRISQLYRVALHQWHATPVTSRKWSGRHQNKFTREEENSATV